MSRSSVNPGIVRPDGRVYRPRSARPRIRAWGRDSAGWGGVIVFGPLEVDRALPPARAACRYWYEGDAVRNPRPGWDRDGFHWGERRWIRGERRRAPGASLTHA